MSETENTQSPVTELNTQPEKTFSQAEVDALIGKRLAKAMRGMPGEDELTAFRAWKESQQTEKEKWEKLTKERDESNTALTAAKTELEQLKREKLLISKGISADDVDYYAYKIGKLVTDSKTFEQAAEDYLKENAQRNSVRVSLTAPLSGGGNPPTANDAMNALIRSARK